MESTQFYFPISPASALVALVTIVFLLRRAWPRLYQQKRTTKLADAIETHQELDLVVLKEPEVPDGWWSGRDVFELERRALFSQTWIYLAHISQFKKPGSYQSFDLAGYPIFLIRGKDDKIRAFHNVCRHRAYTITRKESGASTVLGCRYHGWSYDTTGRLVKAPQFDDVPGFDKSQNNLFEIHAHTTVHGMVLVNLNSGEPEPFYENIVSAWNGFSRTSGLEVSSTWVNGQTLTGNFNWKAGMGKSQLNAFTTELSRQISELSNPSPVLKAVRSLMQKSTRMETSLFPITFLCSFEHTGLCLALSIFPASEKKSSIRYDLFTRSAIGNTESEVLSKSSYEVTEKLVRELEDHYQAILVDNGSSIEVNASITDTRQILSRIQKHTKLEKIQGGQILPATHKPKGSILFQQAEQLCQELDCVSGGSQNGTSSNALDW
ncbi:hypothetical protein N7508_007209 [Penicillium antarcticum]|uniref:uncharacterized protein n=1 Tax=Penicillium antarcticum TaxID=416450 RepID=UPI0023A52906|nr:uncharacterized protein N7508_007209 [Penicillium antarcticum]KAJ5302346.1 hypothetical protein N7508_007209 [Penicillium antarcticum]